MAVHRYKRHGVKRDIRRYIHTTFCPACLLEFWTRERVVAHLSEKSPSCTEIIVKHFAPISEQMAADLDMVEVNTNISLNRADGRRRHFIRDRPCVRLLGPLRYPIMLEGRHHPMGCGKQWRA